MDISTNTLVLTRTRKKTPGITKGSKVFCDSGAFFGYLLFRGTLQLEGIHVFFGVVHPFADVGQLLLDLSDFCLRCLLGRRIDYRSVKLVGGLVQLKLKRRLLVLKSSDLCAKLLELIVPDLY